MKKLILAAAIVCSAAFVHAVNLSWNTYAMDTAYNGLDNGKYWLVALESDSGASSSFVVYGDGTTDFGGHTVVQTGTIPSGSYGAVGGTVTGLTEADNGSVYALVVWDGNADGVFAAAEGVVSGIVETPPTDASPMSFGSGGMMIATTDVTPAPTPIVPEPTTYALVGLAAAALALRKRFRK